MSARANEICMEGNRMKKAQVIIDKDYIKKYIGQHIANKFDENY